MSEKYATIIRHMEHGNGPNILVRCDPPWTDYDGETHRLVLISAGYVECLDRYETYVFAADRLGTITDWSSCKGSKNNVNDALIPLRDEGYTITNTYN